MSMARLRSLGVAAGLAGILATAPALAANLVGTAAKLQGMDKVTARISSFEAPIGEAVRYGNLEIVVRSCRKRPPEEQPESAAYLEISEIRPGKPKRKVFDGWMFASSPALSAMEHPVYDIWVVDCKIPGAPDPKPKTRNKAVKKH
jgi:hypothetical protein